MKVQVSVERIIYLKSELAKFNKMDLDDIEFTSFGEPIEIDPKIISNFELTGLSNTDFITSRYYEMKDLKNEDTKI